MSHGLWQQGTAPPLDPDPCPPCHWHPPKPPVLIPPGPAGGSDFPPLPVRWSLCAGVSPGRATSCPLLLLLPHFGVPAALGSPGLKVAPRGPVLDSAGCPGSALPRMTRPQGGVNVPRASGRAGGCATPIASLLCDPGTDRAGVCLGGQQGPNPRQSLTCSTLTLTTSTFHPAVPGLQRTP